MSQDRIHAAVNELAAAIIEHVQGGGAGVLSSAPAPSTAPVTSSWGQCPVHHVDWRTTKRDGTPAKRAFCAIVTEEGSYCDQRGPWLQSR